MSHTIPYHQFLRLEGAVSLYPFVGKESRELEEKLAVERLRREIINRFSEELIRLMVEKSTLEGDIRIVSLQAYVVTREQLTAAISEAYQAGIKDARQVVNPYR